MLFIQYFVTLIQARTYFDLENWIKYDIVFNLKKN